MGEVVRRSFGESINYEDLRDPDVAHLKLWEHSPSSFFASWYEEAKRGGWPRAMLRLDFDDWDKKILSEISPYTDRYVHCRWLEAIRYDPATFELLEDAPLELLDELRGMPCLGANNGAPILDSERWAYKPKYVPLEASIRTRAKIGELLKRESVEDEARVLQFRPRTKLKVGEPDEEVPRRKESDE